MIIIQTYTPLLGCRFLDGLGNSLFLSLRAGFAHEVSLGPAAAAKKNPGNLIPGGLLSRAGLLFAV